MGLLDRLRGKRAEHEGQPPAAAGPQRKSKRAARIVCSCGKEFSSEAKHHRHLHAEHPEHAH